MIYGGTKTRMDYILDHGFRRIDSAIEGVIAKYPAAVNPCNAGTLHIYEKGTTVDKSTYADYPNDVLRDMAGQQREACLDAQILQNSYRAQQGGLFGGTQNQPQGLLAKGMRPGFW